VLYVSPLKALAVDVERNLRAPLTGIRQASQRLDLPIPTSRSASGPATPRRRAASLQQGAAGRLHHHAGVAVPGADLRGPRVAARRRDGDRRRGARRLGTKRGAHLAVSLERLDELLGQPAQRIGLSATVRPIDEVARFLGGTREVVVVQPPSTKTIEVQVVVPVEDMAALGESAGPVAGGSAAGAEPRASIWPAIEERIVDLVEQHRATIVFSNSRRQAERLTSRLNEIATERLYPTPRWSRSTWTGRWAAAA
jgi:ATP-dependent Lhr-like helicase